MKIKIGRLKIDTGIISLVLLFLGMMYFVYVYNLLFKAIQIAFAGFFFLRMIQTGGMLVIKEYGKYYIIYLIWVLLSVLWTYEQIDINTILLMMINAVIILQLPYYIENKKTLQLIFQMILFSAAILSIYIVSYVGISHLTESRLDVGFINSNTFGTLLSYTVLFSIYLGDEKNWLYRLYIIPAAGLMLISGSKSGLLVSAVMIMTYFWFSRRKNTYALIKSFLIVAAGLLILLWIVMQTDWAYEIIGKRLAELWMQICSGFSVQKRADLTAYSDSTAVRFDMIIMGIGFFLSRPVTGYGVDNFQYLYGPLREYYTYAHNNYIETMVDLGTVGFILFYYPRLKALRRLLKANKRCTENILEISLGLALLTGMLFQDMVDVTYNLIFSQCMFVIVYIISDKENESEALKKG